MFSQNAPSVSLLIIVVWFLSLFNFLCRICRQDRGLGLVTDDAVHFVITDLEHFLAISTLRTLAQSDILFPGAFITLTYIQPVFSPKGYSILSGPTLPNMHISEWQAGSRQQAAPAGFEPDKNNWGWNWLERWMAVRPWENRFLDINLKDGV
ncbi:hypothetical protein Taro_041247, partial [Colocasia esculenta]|nr:hypothetical protein [Colocasia esculenta]